ncbi:MAG: alpha/beta hydrolase [Arenicellales bacterium]
MFNQCREGLSSFPVTLSGPSGDLEGKVDCAAGNPLGGAVICHPHPLYGGTLQNKVVHTLAKSLVANNRTAVRFNFRGVGASAGEYDEGTGETDDALAVVDWLRLHQTDTPIILAGFSFGSFVALQAAAQVEPVALITVAPPVRMFDFENLSSIGCPWLLIQGDEDEVVDVNSVVNWVRNLENPPQLEIIHGSSHFFHGKLLELRSVCDDFIKEL